MKALLSVLIFSSFLLYADDFNIYQPTVLTEGPPSAIVNGVNVMTGAFVDTIELLKTPGPMPLELKLEYNPYNQWKLNCPIFHFWREDRAEFLEPGFVNLSFAKEYQWKSRVYSGFTNTSKGYISALTNPKNYFLRFVNDETTLITSSDGITHRFKKNDKYHLVDEIEDQFSNRIKYEHELVEQVFAPKKISSYRLDGEEPFWSVDITHRGETEGERRWFLDLDHSSTAFFLEQDIKVQKAVNEYGKKLQVYNEIVRAVTHIQPIHGPIVTYKYQKYAVNKKTSETKTAYEEQELHVRKKCWEGGRQLINHFSELSENDQRKTGLLYVLDSQAVKLKVRGRVREEPLYQFRYDFDPANQNTSVINCVNQKRMFFFKADQLTHIEDYGYENEFLKSKRFTWGKGEGQYGHLMREELLGKNRELIKDSRYTYDPFGNVLEKNLIGRICSKSSLDTFTVSSTFQEGGKHLLIKETSGKKSVEYRYKDDTSHVEAKFVVDSSGKILLREFRDYDEVGALTLLIQDDGISREMDNLEGVTEKTIKRITNSVSGLPIDERDYYVDFQLGEEKLLKRVTREFDSYGRKIHEQHFDCNNQFAFEEFWEYNRHNFPILYVNPLGHEIRRESTLFSQPLREVGPEGSYEKIWEYDLEGHCISETLRTSSGESKTIYRTVNALGWELSITDSFGNSTKKEYHPMGELWRETLPAVKVDNHPFQPVIKKYYNEEGQLTEEIDAHGQATKKTLNIYNQPLETVYPNGSFETFTYSIAGQLQTHTLRNGSFLTYEYDDLGREIAKCLYSSMGDCLEKTAKSYNSIHLLSETDPLGNTTYYEYDNAGRKSTKIEGEKKTTYHYDSLSRLTETRMWEGNAFTAHIQEYDLLNRIVEERIENSLHCILQQKKYVYDVFGNRSEEHLVTNSGVAITKKIFNVFHQLLEEIDPDGARTVYEYDESYRNDFNQFVLKKTTTDPQGCQRIEIHDALGRVVSVEKRDLFGLALSLQEIEYDAVGNILQKIEHCYYGDEKEKTVITAWEYNSHRLPVTLYEAMNSNDQRVTYTTYTENDEVATIKKPNRTILHYSYNALSLLIEMQSENHPHPVWYRWSYDKNRNPTEVLNCLTKEKTVREYDRYGNICKETLETLHDISYAYDLRGRLKEVLFKENRKVSYAYDDLYMREVHFTDGYYSATHRYLEYDLNGKLLLSSLVNGLGTIRYERDKKGRECGIYSPYLTMRDLHYDSLGHLTSYRIEDSFGKKGFEFTYNTLNQLTKDEKHTYSYDSLYNRRQKNEKSYFYNSLHQEEDVPYDKNGNPFIACEMICTYDALDRLIALGPHRYTYDAFNRRLRADDKEFIYQGNNEVGAIVRGSFKEFRVLGEGKGAEIGASVLHIIDSTWLVPLHDAFGNVSTLLSWRGSLVDCYRYTSFGEAESLYGSITPWGYKGKRLDESGLIFFGRRYYAPERGRFLTTDPKSYQEGPNLYAYTFNCPFTLIDLYGLMGRRLEGWDMLAAPFYFMYDFAMLALSGLMYASDNYLPIPYQANLVAPLLRWMQGQDRSYYPKGYHHSAFKPHEGKQSKNMEVAYLLVNGQNNSLYDAMNAASKVSMASNGAEVFISYNSTQGLPNDTIKSGFLLSRLDTTNPEEVFRDSIDQLFDRGYKSIVILAHSQGGIIAKNVLDHYDEGKLHNISVYTFGSPAQVHSSKLRDFNNYVSNRDGIPLLNPISFIYNAFFTSHITFLQSNKWFWDHDFGGETYQRAVKEVVKPWMDYFND